jgi:YD repeat-containing protein
MIDPNFDPTAIPLGSTRDHNGRLLSYRGKDGFWCVYARDGASRVLSFRDGSGFWCAYTYDAAGRFLTYRDSRGCREGYDADGKYTITRTRESPYAA